MEASKLTSGWLRVEGEAVKVFTSKKRLKMLESFVGGECTVKEAAVQTRVPLNLMHYHVMKFLELGLLEVTRFEKRRGRAVKHYRAVADGFFVPYDSLPTATTKEHIKAYDAPLNETLLEAIAVCVDGLELGQRLWGRRFERDERGTLGMLTGPDPEELEDFNIISALLEDRAPAFWNLWDTLELEPSEAKRFRRELSALAQQ